METAIKELKAQLTHISTESILGMISLNFVSVPNYDGSVTNMLASIMNIPLKSPQRQLIYLAGLTLSTNEIACPRHIDRIEFSQILQKVQDITFKYIEGFINNLIF